MKRTNFISRQNIRCAECGHGKGVCNCTGEKFKINMIPGNVVSANFDVFPQMVISPGTAVTHNGLNIGTVIATNGSTATIMLEGVGGRINIDQPQQAVSMGVRVKHWEEENE